MLFRSFLPPTQLAASAVQKPFYKTVFGPQFFTLECKCIIEKDKMKERI